MRTRTMIAVVLVALSHAATTSQAGRAVAEDAPGLRISHCVVSLLNEAQIPARKPGVILRFAVSEGSAVKAGEELAQIDDADVRVQLKVAQRQFEAAQQQAEIDIDVRYAKAAALVAKAEVIAAEDANARVAGTVPRSEIRRLELDQNRAVLGIEQAEVQFALAAIEARGAEAQVEAAQLEVSSRRIISPMAGIVVRLHQHVGEWVDAGQPICHVVGLDTMRVTGFVNVNDYEQSTVLGRPATVAVRLAGGRTEKFTGTIGFASPIVQPGGEYRVWVKVANRRLGESWVLRPGLAAQMSIEIP